MFEVRNSNGELIDELENFNGAKAIAENFKMANKQNYHVYEIKQVWTTQTLDEAIANK